MRHERILVVLGLLAAGACSAGGVATDTDAPTTEVSTTVVVTVPPSLDPPSTQPLLTRPPDPPEQPSAEAPPTRDFSVVGDALEAFVADNDLDGAGLVVVDRVEGVVEERYVGAFSADRVSLVASSSKMVTAGVLMRLDDDGLLDVDTPVADAVSWGSGNPDITPAQLVSNSSGLVGLAPNPAYGPYVCQFLAQGELEACGTTVFETPDDDADVVAPDTEFRYGGAQWQVAGAVAEAVSGRSWADLIEEIYVQPCGTDSMGYNNHWFGAGGFGYPAGHDPLALPTTENPHMEGGLYITAPDYAALLLMHLRGGECEGGRVLSAESVGRMHADRVGATYGDAGEPDTGYGLGWFVDRETGIITDPGAYGSVPWLDIDGGYGAFLVIEASADLGIRLADEMIPLVAGVMTTTTG